MTQKSLVDSSAPSLMTAAAAQLAVEHNPGPVFILDPAGLIRYANPAALALLGRPTALVLGGAFLSLLDPGSAAKGRALLVAARSGPTPLYDLNQITADGQVALVSYRAVPLDHGGQTLLLGQAMAAAVALTERLVGLNQRLNALFAISAEAAQVFDSASMLARALKTIRAALDLRAAAVLLADAPLRSPGHPTPQSLEAPLRPAANDGFAPALVERVASPAALAGMFGAAALEGGPLVRYGDPPELGLRDDDLPESIGPVGSLAAVPLRSERQVLGWLLVLADRYRPLNDNEQDLLRAFGDLLGPPLENARLYGALRETSGQLQAVLDGIDSGVLLVDREGVVRYANARLGALLGADVAAWPGHTRAALLDGRLVSLGQQPPFADGELWALAGPGGRVLRRFTDQVADPRGAVVGAIEVYSDITEIQQMNRLKDEFLAAAAHDLKTPVTAMKGYAQIALRLARKLDDRRLIQSLDLIDVCSNDLSYLMDSLLDMSRIQAGQLLLELDSFPVDELFERVQQHFKFVLQRQRRVITFERPDEPLEVRWDQRRVERVLMNIVGNAIKYTPQGGPIEVLVRRLPDDEVECVVTDHGVGIAPAERALVFERFYRTHQSIADGFSGTGLGLYISRWIIETHGGQIWAADPAHGGPGVAIHFRLPRCVVVG